jgi:hypothetical protein
MERENMFCSARFVYQLAFPFSSYSTSFFFLSFFNYPSPQSKLRQIERQAQRQRSLLEEELKEQMNDLQQRLTQSEEMLRSVTIVSLHSSIIRRI